MYAPAESIVYHLIRDVYDETPGVRYSMGGVLRQGIRRRFSRRLIYETNFMAKTHLVGLE